MANQTYANFIRKYLGDGASFYKIGSAAAPVIDAVDGGSAVEIYVNPTAQIAAGSQYKTLRVESYLRPFPTNNQPLAAFTTQGAGLYTVRGLAGVAKGYTFAGSANQGYLAGVQGKLDNKGVIGDNNSGGIYACAGLSQVSGAGTYGTDAQLYGHWIDLQAGMGALPTTTHMLNMTNNSGQTVANGIYLYGGNGVTNFFNLSTCGGMVGAKVDDDKTYAHYRPVSVMIDGVQGWILVGFDS